MASRTPARQNLIRRARRLHRTTGRATHWARLMPSFLIVGTQRGGTTSLHKILDGHPDVMGAPLHKGAHYFDVNYTRGPEWYRGHFPVAVTAQLRHPRRGQPLTFDSSPYYMFHPAVPARIAGDLPGVRLIALLRDPVDRAYSAYTHEYRRGFETETFERALELEEERLDGQVEKLLADPTYISRAHQHQAYKSRGYYADQLQRLYEHVSADRVLVVDSGHFFGRPEEELPRVLDFLGLSPWRPPSYLKANAQPRSDMPESLRQHLREHFADADERLAELLGEAPSWRR